MNKFYTVEAAHSQEQVEDGQCDVVDTCDTLKEAKARAKYLLSDAAQVSFEMSEPLRYARILLNGELDRGCCVADYFRNEDSKACQG